MCMGSAGQPGSLQRSRTAIFFTEAGRARTNSEMAKGLNRRTFRTPTFSPCFMAHSTYSWVVSQPEPMITTTRSASGWPK